MKEIITNLYVGIEQDCNYSRTSELSIIHACKSPCHQSALRYKGSLNSSHPNYLIYEIDNHLYLNIVDMENELLPKYTHPIMIASLRFINKNISNKKVLVHCNLGQSRSPSIILLYLAKNNIINKNSFYEAKKDFRNKYYNNYLPSRGILLYLNNNWQDLINIQI